MTVGAGACLGVARAGRGAITDDVRGGGSATFPAFTYVDTPPCRLCDTSMIESSSRPPLLCAGVVDSAGHAFTACMAGGA